MSDKTKTAQASPNGPPAETKPPAAETKPVRQRDPELTVMQKISTLLDGLDGAAAGRVLDWLIHRHESRNRVPLTSQAIDDAR